MSGLKKRDNSRSVVAWPVVRSKGSTSACNFAGNLQRIKQETTGAAVACKGLAEGCFIVVGNSPDQTRAKLDDELQRQGDGQCRVGHEAWLGRVPELAADLQRNRLPLYSAPHLPQLLFSHSIILTEFSKMHVRTSTPGIINDQILAII